MRRRPEDAKQFLVELAEPALSETHGIERDDIDYIDPTP